MKKRLVALLLTVVMVVSLLPVGVLAAESSDNEPLIYVALGDSMTNGYGLDGYQFDMAETRAAVDNLIADLKERPEYRPEENRGGANNTCEVLADSTLPQWRNFPNINNMNGVLMEAGKAYPAQFRKHLAEATGKEVDLIQLGMSGSRMHSVLRMEKKFSAIALS